MSRRALLAVALLLTSTETYVVQLRRRIRENQTT